ncbi:MAG: histidinol-phosphate transaminase [Synergistaceae bacterium]|nr:histidinol-phosphate transaminase [Synergistaceae bacterium]
MSFTKFFNKKYLNIAPYDTAGEHLELERFIKLNTNESPFAPSPLAIEYAARAAANLNLYSDPDCTQLVNKLAASLEVEPENILCGNGSDEILNFIFAAFCDETQGAAFPDITYSFYKVLAEFHGVNYVTPGLDAEFKINLDDYIYNRRTSFIVNPNAPTGLLISLDEIEKLLRSNPDNIVAVDEAYIDFAGDSASAVKLINKYNNLIVVQTFSKSRSLAGGRLGFAAAHADLIRDLKAIKNSLAPYNINSMTQAAAIGALEDKNYFDNNINLIKEARAFTAESLKALGFAITNSQANFIFAEHEKISGQKLFDELRAKNILVRHFAKPERVNNFIRVTIGSMADMKIFVNAVQEILNKND